MTSVIDLNFDEVYKHANKEVVTLISGYANNIGVSGV